MPLLRNIIISILLVGMVFTILINLYADMYINYAPYTNVSAREEELNDSYTKWNESRDLIVKLSDKIYNSTSRAETGSENLITSSYGTVKLYASTSHSIYRTLIDNIGTKLQIPGFIRNTFIGIIVVAITFTILSGVLRHQW